MPIVLKSWSLKTWKPQGLSRPVQRLPYIYLYLYFVFWLLLVLYCFCFSVICHLAVDSAYKQTGVGFIVIIVVVVLHHRTYRDSLVGMGTRLRVGQPMVLSSIRGMAKTFFSETFWTALVPIQPHF
jgi:hypothetical protein